MVVGTLFFGAKRSNQWIQWMQWIQWTQYTVDAVNAVDTVCSGRSRIVIYGGGDIVLWCKKVKPVDSVDAVTQWTQYAVDAVE